MDVAELLTDTYGRVREEVHAVLEGLGPDALAHRIDPDANSISWLVWHLARVTDDHLADAFDVAQVWTSQGWYERLGLPLAADDIGYGHTSRQVADVAVRDAGLLLGYHDAVHEQALELLGGVVPADLDRIVDRRWGGVTLGVRLVSVASDALQHVGQAAFVRGVLDRTRST